MIVELVLAFVLCLVVLKRLFFKEVSYIAILGLTALLVVLIAATNYPHTPAKRGTELFDDDENYRHGRKGGVVRETFTSDATTMQQVNFLGEVIKKGDLLTKKSSEEGTYDDSGKNGEMSSSGPPPSVDVKTLLTEDMDEITTSLQSFHISSATAKLSFYYSVYSPVSYSPTNKNWNNMMDAKTNLVFSAQPGSHNNGIDLIRGMPLGLLSLTGPNSSSVGFSSKGAFTLFFQIRFSDLAKKDKMNLISFYSASATSTDTEGLVVQLVNVNRDDIVQTAQIVIVLSNNAPLYCTIEGKTQLPFDENATYVFSIVKTATTMDAYMSSSTQTQAQQILKRVNLKAMDNFANIPMSLNGNKNVDGKIMAFGGYNINLSASDVQRVHNYLMKQEKKVNDKDYVEALIQIKSLEDRYRKISSCPFDMATCGKCKEVDWLNVLQTANKECIDTIEQQCGRDAAQSSVMCGCWNPKSKTYDSIRCVNLRKAMADKELHDIEQLDKDTIATIKDKYEVCPKPKPPAKPPMVCVPKPPAAASEDPTLVPPIMPPPPPPPPPLQPPPPPPVTPQKKCDKKKKKCNTGGGMHSHMHSHMHKHPHDHYVENEPRGLMSWLGAMFDV